MAGRKTAFICGGAPAHRRAKSPSYKISPRMLPLYSLFLNIVEIAISALRAAIKNDISRPEMLLEMKNRIMGHQERIA